MNQDIVWSPSEPQNTQLFSFLSLIHERYGLAHADYDHLHEWSIAYPDLFWKEAWDFLGIQAFTPYHSVIKKNGTKTQWFAGAKLNFAANLLKRRDKHTALLSYDEKGLRGSLSYCDLHKKVATLAYVLRSWGVQKGDRIASILPNITETVIASLASASIGAIWSSCSPELGADAILERFLQIKPKILFVIDEYLYAGKTYKIIDKIKALHASMDSLERTIIVSYKNTCRQSDNLNNTISFKKVTNGSQRHFTFASLPFDHPLYILYSSGTTGAPKCIVHGAGGTLLQHLKELVLHVDLKESDIIFYHTTCAWMMWNWMLSSLAVGATVMLYHGSPTYPSEARLLKWANVAKVTVFGTSAAYLRRLAKQKFPLYKKYRLLYLRTILSTGSPLLPEIYDYIYEYCESKVALCSMSGGTDIISCFALGNPILPIYRGELQCRGLGMDVAIFDQNGYPLRNIEGELVCRTPFPSMPLFFWNDVGDTKYHQAYFSTYPNVWAHGDWAKLTEHNGIIIDGRSDTLLNPHGIRIGTAELYRPVETIDTITDSVAVSQRWDDETRIILFVTLQDEIVLDDDLITHIKQTIREHTSAHHVPAKIIAIPDIPYTLNGKLAELAVCRTIHGKDIPNLNALRNPESLEHYKHLAELEES